MVYLTKLFFFLGTVLECSFVCFLLSDFVQNLISQKKCVEAVRFIHAFELVDKFPPVPLLRNHVNDAKKVAKSILKNSKSSPKEKV